MKIDINKTYRYRNGEPARILCQDAPGREDSVISLTAGGWIHRHYKCGSYLEGERNSLDLIEVREPRDFWINIYPGRGTALHETLESAEDGKAGGFANVETIRVREILD